MWTSKITEFMPFIPKPMYAHYCKRILLSLEAVCSTYVAMDVTMVTFTMPLHPMQTRLITSIGNFRQFP